MNCATFYFVTWSTLFTMTKTVGKVGDQTQCDQMSKLFFNIWPFTSLKICSVTYKIYQSGFKILANTKYTLKI